MTAYGHGAHQNSLGRFTAEIQSVNRKHLDIRVQLPKIFKKYEIDIQKRIAEEVGRGVVNVWVDIDFTDTLPYKLKPNLPLAREIYSACRSIENDLGKNFGEQFAANLMIKETELFERVEETENEMDYREGILSAVSEALKPFLAMKKFEGEKMSLDLMQRIDTIDEAVKKIGQHSGDSVQKYQEKLGKAIEEYLPGNVENEERLLREIVVFSERVDIAEEITRLQSHLLQFKELAAKEKGGLGKNLEFLVQEMAREANTIGAKSQSLEVSRLLVDVKSEIDRIREQLQNIE